MNDLQLYSIMPLDTVHLEEICQDVRHQYENGTATCALFMMTLVPEGDPPVDKVGVLCAKFDLFRDRLAEMGLTCGVLVQATIGHGWVLSEPFPFQPFTALDTGHQPQIVCPMDEGFRDYIEQVFATIAAHHPATIMLDDDFRLMSFREGNGCGCPLHLAEVNRRANTNYTREELNRVLHEHSPEGDRMNPIMIQIQQDSLIDCAKRMRRGIDSVDPTIPGSFCCVGNNVECAVEIAQILSGKGHPTVVRINNGNYTAAGPRFFSDVFLRAAQSIAKLKGKVDVILAETDTCPQNRYSTSALSLHTHFTGTLLEGAAGAKHWITRLHAFEPESGVAYRNTLGAYAGFYKTIASLAPTLHWRGCRIPTTDRACFDYRKNNSGTNGWSRCVLERLGLPMYFSPDFGGVTCLEGDVDAAFDDATVQNILSGATLIASDAAERLIQRGFGDYLGVDVRPWQGAQPSYEMLPPRNNPESVQVRYRELVPDKPDVQVLSTVIHTVDGEHMTELFPGVTAYKNQHGGTAFVFCGTPRTYYSLTEAFSFLNFSRKEQLIEMLRSVGELPIYYPGDAEMYLRAADMPDGGRFCALFNLGLDPIENLPLICDRPVTAVEVLQENGTFYPISFRMQDGVLVTDCTCRPLEPLALRII